MTSSRAKSPHVASANPGSGQIGMAAAVSIGIGGMVGAGIFSILGVVAQAAGNAMWLAFAIGGVVALLSTYSYAKLGATFPSAGGAVHFLVKSFGDGVLAGGLNLFMWVGYIISLALYATAFGSYAATFVTTAPSPLLVKSLAVGSVVLLTVVNAFGAKLMGRSETVIVAIKVAILVLFAAVGLWFIRPGYLSPELWPEAKSILFGAGVLFIGYEGFGLVTNAAGDMRNPRTMLPRALYTSVILVIVIYLAVSLTVTGNLSDLRDRAGQGLCAGRGGQAVPGRVRLPADRDRGAVLDRLGDQRHAVRLGQRLLHDRPRRRAAGRTIAHRMEAGHRRAAAHRRPGRAGDLELRPVGHRHDGKRRLPAGLCRGERGAPAGCCNRPGRTRSSCGCRCSPAWRCSRSCACTPISSSRWRSRRSSSSPPRRSPPNGPTGAGQGERSRKTSRSIFRRRSCPDLIISAFAASAREASPPLRLQRSMGGIPISRLPQGRAINIAPVIAQGSLPRRELTVSI